MKTQLTIEESAKLIELGIDSKLASDEYGGGDCRIIPIFTLTDILSILPKEICGGTALLNLAADNTEWFAAYYDCNIYSHISVYKDSAVLTPEFIDSLYKLLIWVITNGHLNQKK